MTKEEKKLLEIIRELRPYEVVEIQKDKNGKPNAYFVTRTQKVVIQDIDNLS